MPCEAHNVLLEQNGTETRVKSTNTLLLQDLGETTDQAVGEGRLRHQSDTGGLEGAEGNVSDEFGACSRGEVDGGAVLDGTFVADQVDALLLEEFVTTELEGTLKEVTGKSRPDTGPKSASTLIGDNLTETTDETLVVSGRIKLDPRLDAVQD